MAVAIGLSAACHDLDSGTGAAGVLVVVVSAHFCYFL
jgi:hypothetical protein